MALENKTVLDLTDDQDKTLDSSFRFLLQDPYIEACLLKDFCEELKDLDIKEIEELLRKDGNGISHSRIELLNGVSKIQGLSSRDAEFVYKIDNGEIHFFVDIEAQRNHLDVVIMLYQGQDYCKRINVAEQIRSAKLPLSALGKAYCFFLCFLSSSNKEEVIYFKNCRSENEYGPYIPALSSMSEVIIINLGLPFEKMSFRSSKLLWILFKYPMPFSDKIRMLKDELGIELEKESEKELGKMCDYLREIMEQGKEYWIEQGFDQGKEQGIEQGIEKGIQKGAFGNLVLNIKSLINKGQSFDEACYLLDVDDTTKERIKNSEILLS